MSEVLPDVFIESFIQVPGIPRWIGKGGFPGAPVFHAEVDEKVWGPFPKPPEERFVHGDAQGLEIAEFTVLVPEEFSRE